MSISFLSSLLGRIPINIQAIWHRVSISFTLDRRNFPDCDDKQFTYGRRLWNPFGKVGLAHHGPAGWDFFLPEELEKK